jgi:hypothetical protein
MNTAFTICSNNYLAEAKVLAESFRIHHPDFQFIIGLVDEKHPSIDYDSLGCTEVITVGEIGLDDLPALYKQFTIVELNTTVKPAYFHYIFNRGYEKVIYIDPDVMVTSHFDEVVSLLDQYHMILTPSMFTPVDDGYSLSDFEVLRSGVFNLGFLALSHYTAVKSFLDWWHARLLKYGYKDFSRGMFHDQLWINYVPCLFDHYFILKHPGYNAANWNLHERHFRYEADGNVRVNEQYPLRFFHFSGYHATAPDVISCYSNRYNFKSRPDVWPLFQTYARKLEANEVTRMKTIPVKGYTPDQIPAAPAKPSVYRKVRRRLVRASKILLFGAD